MSTNALFSPLKFGNQTLQHRVVLAPATRLRNTAQGVPTDLVVEYYRQRASEGGLLITESTFIVGGFPHAPGIYNKEQIEGWKKVTNAVHEKKGLIFCQLMHVGRGGPPGEPVVSASAIRIKGKSLMGYEYQVPHALEIDEIKSVIQDFQQAALNAIEAGFDGVEIHGANGFLVDQFINSNSNKRTDMYGGSIENRARFALEVVDSIATAIGQERTAIRFSPEGTSQDMGDDTPVETWSHLTSELSKRHPNLGYIHFLEPRTDIYSDAFDTLVNDRDSLEPYRKLWKGPFITSGGFSNNLAYAKDLAERTGTLISFGRAFIANPDLPERLRNGWELNKYDRSTFYTNDAVGYTDYPFYTPKN